MATSSLRLESEHPTPKELAAAWKQCQGNLSEQSLRQRNSNKPVRGQNWFLAYVDRCNAFPRLRSPIEMEKSAYSPTRKYKSA